jgi:protein phosphatase PTC6
MGAIENTRSFGDGDYKPLGVTAEPEVKHRILNGESAIAGPRKENPS